MLGIPLDDDEDMLTDSIERELKKMDDPKKVGSFYKDLYVCDLWLTRKRLSCGCRSPRRMSCVNAMP